MIFTIKRGDTSPTLLLALGPPHRSIEGASVTFSMVLKGRSEPKVCDHVPAEFMLGYGEPVVGHAWLPAHTEIAGVYSAEFQIVFADDSIETFPNGHHLTINIEPDL